MDSLTVLTGVLVLVTGYYAFQTRKTVQAMEQQREDSMLPVVVIEGFDIHPINRNQDTYCIGVSLKNIGNGPAFGIMIEFFDAETKKFIARSEHFIDYLEKSMSEDLSIHVSKEEFNDIRYEDLDGRMVCRLVALVTFKNFYSREVYARQMFVLEKSSMKIKPVVGTFKFEPNKNSKDLEEFLEGGDRDEI